jgi:hypothetical protein
VSRSAMLLVRIAEAMAFAAHIRRRTALFPVLANPLPPWRPLGTPSRTDIRVGTRPVAGAQVTKPKNAPCHATVSCR